MKTGPHRFRIGEIQASALEIYVLDPIHADDGPAFPGGLLTGEADASMWILEVDRGNEALAWRLISDGSNSADASFEEQSGHDPLDKQMAAALATLSSRVARTVTDWRAV